MNTSFFKVDALSSEHVENAFICETRKLVAVTTQELKLKLYSFTDLTADLNFVREYKGHAGAILAGAFAPVSYHAYFITAGYDKTLNLYNFEDSKQTEAVFSYTTEDPNIGYFTCVAFIPVDKSRLLFAAGTSTGHVAVFDSQANFEPKIHQPFKTAIKTLSGNNSGDLTVAATGSAPKLIFDLDFENATDFSDDVAGLTKTFAVGMAPRYLDDQPSLLFTASEDQTLSIWEIDQSLKIPKLLQTVELKHQILSAAWNIGSLSVTVLCSKKDEKLSDLKTFRVTSIESEDRSRWVAHELESKN